MYIPIIQKINYRNDLFLERSLPTQGYLTANIGENVQPFSKLGMSKISHEQIVFGDDLKLSRGKKLGSYFYQGEKIGSMHLIKIVAPFNGYIAKDGANYVFKQEERDYWLLAGAWGTVVDMIKDTSVLLKTQVIDIKFVTSTNQTLSGEFIVFPNPGEALVMEYLENLSKNLYKKIVYIGDYVTEKAISKAADLGVLGILAGGVDKAGFSYAKKAGLFLGIFTGFGQVVVPHQIFEILKRVSNRFVFVDGEHQLIRVPVPERFPDIMVKDATKSTLKFVKVGLEVLVLQKPFFGKIGTVDRVNENSILVKFPDKEGTTEIFVPNVLALE
jgi:hypothetical protein